MFIKVILDIRLLKFYYLLKAISKLREIMLLYENTKWDFEADVVVLGSGGAALTSAILAHD